MAKVRCPTCGNSNCFTIVLNYARFFVEANGNGYYTPVWEETTLDWARCEQCGAELSRDLANDIFLNIDFR